jgi:hypothetical protein
MSMGIGMACLRVLALIPLLLSLFGCGMSPSSGPVHEFSQPGTLFRFFYKYDNGCVGWELDQATPYEVGGITLFSWADISDSDDCSIPPVPNSIFAGSGSATSSFDRLVRQMSVPGPSGIVFIADAFTAIDAFDLSSGKQLATMPVLGNPFDIVGLPGQNLLYAVLYPANGAVPAIAVIDRSKLKIVASIPLPANTFPQFAAISGDGSTLYVNNAGSSELGPSPASSILVIDIADQTVKATIPISSDRVNQLGYYSRLALSPDGNLLYAQGQASIEVIDTLTLMPVAYLEFPPGNFPENAAPTPHMVFAPNGNTAYIAASGPSGPSIVVVDTATSQVLTKIPIGGPSSYVSDLVMTLNGPTLWVIDQITGSTIPVDTRTGQVGTPLAPLSFPGSSNTTTQFSSLGIVQ